MPSILNTKILWEVMQGTPIQEDFGIISTILVACSMPCVPIVLFAVGPRRIRTLVKKFYFVKNSNIGYNLSDNNGIVKGSKNIDKVNLSQTERMQLPISNTVKT